VQRRPRSPLGPRARESASLTSLRWPGLSVRLAATLYSTSCSRLERYLRLIGWFASQGVDTVAHLEPAQIDWAVPVSKLRGYLGIAYGIRAASPGVSLARGLRALPPARRRASAGACFGCGCLRDP
jgi:hypothetical protein